MPDIKNILKNVVSGKNLTDEEKDFLAKYEPEQSDSRGYKAKFDEEALKHKTEKERADNLSNELAALQEKFENLENAGKSEAEKAKIQYEKEIAKLGTQVKTLTKERDEALSKFQKAERRAVIEKLSEKYGFTDSEYLDFLLSAKSIDLSDENTTSAFMQDLGKSSQHLFKSSAKPGSSTSTESINSTNAQNRLKELLGKKELTPREAGEVIKIQEEIKANSSENKTQKES